MDAQITLLNSYPVNGYMPNNFQSVYLKHSGFKFVYLQGNTLSFYNLNLSLYKNVTIPGGAPTNVLCISEGLFDTDTLHIDYIVTHLRRPVSDPERRKTGERRTEVQPISHHRSLLANAPGVADRAQSSFGGHGRHH